MVSEAGDRPFGRLLRDIRTNARLSQEELAERAGLSVKTVGNLERGRARRPYRRSLQLLADAMQLTGPLRDEFLAAGRRTAQRPEAPASPVRRAEVVVPRQLPAGVRQFAGRATELAALDALLNQAEDASGTAVISAIGGTAGVGKTALAVHWAHRAAGRFPDGQLYVNLRGYDLSQPMPAADALASFLRALGLPSREIPPEPDERAARYRSLLAGRRMLVVLDNAGGVEQARPLLPGTPGCVTVVTSRDSLAGLVARDGAQRLDLDLLPLGEAAGLLRALIGERAGADRAATTELARQCARLPLALRVAAELAVSRPAATLADLVGELADQQRRLELLDAGADPRTAVRAVFSWSYRHLDDSVARAFRLLGLDPGPDLDPYAAAALTGTTTQQAAHALGLLARAHLTQPTQPGRYGMHDLLRAYARELATTQDSPGSQRMALGRLFDHYLHTAAAAVDTLFPAERDRRPRIPPVATPSPVLTSAVAARDWLDAQRATMVVVAAYTASHGWPSHATRLAATLFRYLDTGDYYSEASTIYTCACRAARHTGDQAAEATALINLGFADWTQARYEPAVGHFQQAMTLGRATGDRIPEARAHHGLGLVALQQDRYREATSHFQRTLELYRVTGDLSGQARALGNLGAIDRLQGRYPEAIEHQQEALGKFREIGDRAGEAEALTRLGVANLWLGRYPEAAGHQEQALAVFREIGERGGQARALTRLGVADLRLGRYPEAADHQQQALGKFREIGDRAGEGEALNGLGDVLLARGQANHARTQHTIALRLTRQIGDKYQQAHALNGLGHACQALGDPSQARRRWQRALALYTELGTPEAAEVQAQLGAGAAAGNPGNPGDQASGVPAVEHEAAG
ncbi:MAG TPA: tetratricopeptide repeat protein [Streptosporangiaceae bacterium]